jgi:acetyl esterase/lipase
MKYRLPKNTGALAACTLVLIVGLAQIALGQNAGGQLQPGPLSTPGVTVTQDVVYGHKDGMALTYDVFKPARPNGGAVIHVQCGGWVSRFNPPERLGARDVPNYDEVLKRGFTLIQLRHGSSPRYNVPEVAADVDRGVRHIHMTAAQLGIDVNRIGIYGNSCGGMHAVLVGVKGDSGNPAAEDPVMRAGTRVAAVVSFYAPTDLDPAAQAVLPLDARNTRYPALNFDYAKHVKEVSPIHHISADDPPTLILHGDKDETVPVKEAHSFHAAFQQKGVATHVIIFPGAGHSFQANDARRAATALGDWFSKYLTGKRSNDSR